MFEAAELGRKISKAEFKQAEQELRTELLAVQRALRTADFPVVVIVSGVEGAGKSEVVNRFSKWLDMRGVVTTSFFDETEEERERPRYWRFWRTLPANGQIGVFYGSWYTQPIIQRVLGEMDEAAYERELSRIASFERMLALEGALFVKLWFHLSENAVARMFDKHSKKEKKALRSEWRTNPYSKRFAKRYREFAEVSERAIRMTDLGVSPWHIVEAEDRRYRELRAGQLLLQRLRERLKRAAQSSDPQTPEEPIPEPGEDLTVLSRVDLEQSLEESSYRKQLKQEQARLRELTLRAREAKRSTVILFEGWDAAGKGGAIRRVCAAMDARLYRVIPIAAPTDEERAHHYLWRFWRHLPRAGFVTIFDRTWYGRVLVERVEGFASSEQWKRAFLEINRFEEELAEHGTVVCKFWLHLSPEEQLRRFEERQATPWKQHKITEEDWRNRERWGAYERAVNDMVVRTSTSYAPWTLVAGDDKLFARVQVVRAVCDQLEAALKQD